MQRRKFTMAAMVLTLAVACFEFAVGASAQQPRPSPASAPMQADVVGGFDAQKNPTAEIKYANGDKITSAELKDCRKATVDGPGRYLATCESIARRMLRAGDYSGAGAYFWQSAQETPVPFDTAVMRYGREMEAAGAKEQAAEMYVKGCDKTGPALPSTCSALAKISEEAGDKEKAQNYRDKAQWAREASSSERATNATPETDVPARDNVAAGVAQGLSSGDAIQRALDEQLRKLAAQGAAIGSSNQPGMSYIHSACQRQWGQWTAACCNPYPTQSACQQQGSRSACVAVNMTALSSQLPKNGAYPACSGD